MKNSIKYLVLSTALLISSCNVEGLKEIPTDQFLGTWSLQGRGMFEGMEIEITEEGDNLKGRINKLNDNKYVQMFAHTNDIWVSEISRTSNYQFRLTEKKIARELFSLYSLPTSNEFRVEFIDTDTIGLAGEGKDPQNASIKYVRVK